MLHFSIRVSFLLSQCTIPMRKLAQSPHQTVNSYNQDFLQRDESSRIQKVSDSFRTESFSRKICHSGSRIRGWKVCGTVWPFTFLKPSFLSGFIIRVVSDLHKVTQSFISVQFALVLSGQGVTPFNEWVGGLSPKIMLMWGNLEWEIRGIWTCACPSA